MSTSEKFMKAEAGKQSAFGTPATPDILMPFTGNYVDAQEDHNADYDTGYWTPIGFAAKVADYVTFTLNGTSFFETLPILLSAGHADLTPSGAGPYTYDDDFDVTTVGAASPYTFQFGANENIGGTGPSIRVQDGYCESMSLAFSLTAKQVAMTSNWFGLQVDDNSDAGFAFQGASLPSTLQIMQGMRSQIEYQDAGTTGDDFLTMTQWDCSILSWTLNINFGTAAKWAAEENQLTYCGLRHNMPEITWSPVIRTDSTNYAAVKVKAEDRVHQEVLLTINGDSSAQVKFKLTGRFLPNFVAHGRDNDEVVMAPTFRCETPHDQTTTPHFFGWELDTNWSHT